MRATLFLSLVALTGCGLDHNGLGSNPPDDAGPDDVTTIVDAAQEPPVVEAAPDVVEAAADACVSSIPTGWGLVYFETTLGLCPNGYSNQDGFVNPVAMPGACACDCALKTQPTCLNGSLHWSSGPGCAMAGPDLTITGPSECPLKLGAAMPLPPMASATPLALSGGTCDIGQPNPDTSKVMQTSVRACLVPAADQETACESQPLGGFSTCIMSAGDVACPPGTDFQTKTVMASSNTLTCSDCTTCNVQGTCGSAFLEFYSDDMCMLLVGSEVVADGKCHPTGAHKNDKFQSVAYTAAPTSTGCTTDGSMATFQPVAQQTLCCR